MKCIIKALLPIVLCLILSGLLMGCGNNVDEQQLIPKQDSDLETAEFDKKDVKVLETQTPDETAQKGNFSLVWANEEIGSPEYFSISEGKIYAQVAGVEGPKLYVINADTGSLLEFMDLNLGHFLLGVSNKAVFFDAGSYFFALDKKDWNELWRMDWDETTGVSVTKSGLICNDKDHIYMIEDNINQPLWSHKGFQYIYSSRSAPKILPKGVSGLAMGGGIPPEQNFFSGIGNNFIYISSIEETIDQVVIKINRYDLITGSLSGSVPWLIYSDDGTRLELQPFQWDPFGEVKGNLLTRYFSAEGLIEKKIGFVNIEKGQLEWTSEELDVERIESVTRNPHLYDEINNTLILFGEAKHGNISYTVWYGLDAADGKTVWKKQVQSDRWIPDENKEAIHALFMHGSGNAWVQIINGVLIIGRAQEGKLTFVDTLSGEILDQEEVPSVYAGKYSQLITFKQHEDNLIVITEDGLNCYHVKK